MAMYEPAYLPPNAEEQDFVQAYENVREMYKGGNVKQKPAVWQVFMFQTFLRVPALMASGACLMSCAPY